MRVLVTGGRGFVGARVVDELARRGREVVPLGREDGDLAEDGVAAALLERHGPELVVHLAARVGRAVAEAEPARTVRENVTAALLVARACSGAGVRLAHGSSSEVYGATRDRPAEERDLLPSAAGGLYTLTKRWAEEAVLGSCPDAIVLRLSLPYGPGVAVGRGGGTIPTMLDQARRGEPVRTFRDAVRSWCYVDDVARAVADVLERGGRGIWNVGRDDDERTLADLGRLACRVVGAPESLVEEVDPPDPATATHRVSTAKLRALGWGPQVELEDGMRRTLAALSPG